MQVIAFELKTEKKSPAEYNKLEVGQAHNHIQWLKDNETASVAGGLLIVGPPEVCKSEASPSPDLFLVETTALVDLMRLFAAKIDDSRGGIAIDRWNQLNELGGLSEWQLPGLFIRLAQTPLQSLKST